MYAAEGVDSILDGYMWVISIGFVSGSYMGFIVIWTVVEADRPWVGNMAICGGLLVDISFFLLKLKLYSWQIRNNANFSLFSDFIKSFSIQSESFFSSKALYNVLTILYLSCFLYSYAKFLLIIPKFI